MQRARGVVLGALVVLLCAAPAFAATGSVGLLDTVQNQYQNATATWLNAAIGWAGVIFAGLIGVEIAWSIIEMYLGSRDLDSLLSSFVLRAIWVGSAAFILNQAPNIVLPAIADFIAIGDSIAGSSGTPVATSADGLFLQGFQIALGLIEATNGDSIVAQGLEIVPQGLAVAMVLFGFGLAAAQFLLTMIQIYVVVGGGAFLLGFIGSRWTLPFAEAYPRMIVSSGMKLVSVKLVAGLGATLGSHWVIDAAKTGLGPVHWLSLGVSALIYGIVGWNLPNIMMQLAGSAPALSASGVFAAAASGASSSIRRVQQAQRDAAARSGGGSAQPIASIEKATQT
jgi:type IV secretion system protein TrbL